VADDEDRVFSRAHLVRGHQKLVPDLGHVGEVLAQALMPPVGLAAPGELGCHGAELHALVAEGGHRGSVTAVEGVE
jgi:hypothetical protein